MGVGEFTKYGVVLTSSLTGAASGFAYSSKALNLRSRLEGSGKKLLRPSDPSWLYERILIQNKEKLKELKDIVNTEKYQETTGQQPAVPKKEKTDLQKLKEFAEDKGRTDPKTEEIIALQNWCQEKLTDAKYNSWSYEDDVTTFCGYPDWDSGE